MLDDQMIPPVHLCYEIHGGNNDFISTEHTSVNAEYTSIKYLMVRTT